MSGFEFNKFLASLVVAIIVFVIIGFVGNFVINIDSNKGQEIAYKIDIPEAINNSNTNTTPNDDRVELISPLLANASLQKGEKIVKKCGTCHTYTKDGKSKVGPNLWNLINRPKASVSGYAYSDSLANSGGSWSYEELNRFIEIYSNHERIVYTYYLLGMCHYEQITDEKKDLGSIIDAQQNFKYVLENYPESDFALDSQFKLELIQEILKRWAEDEINLQSEAAQDALAKEIMHTVLKFINNHDGMELTYK